MFCNSRMRICALLLLLVVACTPTTQRPSISSTSVEAEEIEQKKLLFKTILEQQERLNRVYSRLAVVATDFCGENVGMKYGLHLHSLESFKDEDRKIYALLFPNISKIPSIRHVIPGSNAEKAGFRVGDEITSVNDTDIAPGENAIKTINEILSKSNNPEVKILAKRNNQVVEGKITGVKACSYPLNLTHGIEINAYADGSSIIFTKGMMDFVRTDEEIALILGHEMAHNFRGHIPSKIGNQTAGQVVGTILDLLIAASGVSTGGLFGNMGAQLGGSAFSVDFESEADYAGLYVMARAGYNIDDAPNVWRRMAMNNPKGITHASSHPATAERFVALNEAIKEIKAKQSAGQPLVPNEKPRAEPNPSPAGDPLINLNR